MVADKRNSNEDERSKTDDLELTSCPTSSLADFFAFRSPRTNSHSAILFRHYEQLDRVGGERRVRPRAERLGQWQSFMWESALGWIGPAATMIAAMMTSANAGARLGLDGDLARVEFTGGVAIRQPQSRG